MTFTVSQYESIEVVPSEVWSALTKTDSLFISRAWTLALRASNPAIRVEFWVVLDGEGPLLGVPVHIFPGPPTRKTYDLWSLHDADFDTPDTETARAVTHVLIGTRNGQRNGFLRSSRPAGHAGVALLNAIREGHKNHVVSMLYLEHGILQELLTSKLREHWEAHFLDATAELTIATNDIDAHIDTLPGNRRRTKIRSEYAAMAELPTLTHIDDPDEIRHMAALLAPLAVNLNLKHGQSASDSSMEAYIRATADSGLQVHLFVGGELHDPVSFSLAVCDDRLMSVRLCGFDYNRTKDTHPPEYARLVIYEPLTFAVTNGLETVDLGVGSLQAKTLRGASIAPLYSFYSIPDRVSPRRLPGGDEKRIKLLMDTTPKITTEITDSWRINR